MTSPIDTLRNAIDETRRRYGFPDIEQRYSGAMLDGFRLRDAVALLDRAVAAETALAEATMQANGWRAIAEDANGVMFVTRAEAAERRANDLADALRQIEGLETTARYRSQAATIARAALDQQEQP